ALVLAQDPERPHQQDEYDQQRAEKETEHDQPPFMESGLGHDLEQQAVHCDDAHALARLHRRRAADAPGLAVDARPALRVAVLERLTGAAEELLAPAPDRAPLPPH